MPGCRLPRTTVSITFTSLALLAPPLAGQIPVGFEDASGLIDFVHEGFHLGGDGLAGSAWLDYDNDGDQDLFLVNGKTRPNGLFRNDGPLGFANVAASAGVQNFLGNAAVVAADFDNDGWQDLFLSGDGGTFWNLPWAPIKLYRNNTDGTFTDITFSAGLVSPPTGRDIAVGDIDNDGLLDIFLGAPRHLSMQMSYPNTLWRNNGNMTFTDISAGSGVNTMNGCCAAAFHDYNDDGLQDLFILNCPTAVLMELHRNDGDLTFTNVTFQTGLGAAVGLWMGIEFADHDNDGDLDFFMTNFGTPSSWPHALYRKNANLTYTNIATSAGVAWHEFGWGCSYTDFDNDGWADLFWAGALVTPGNDVIGPGLGNPGTIMFNNGSGAYVEHTAEMPVNMASRSTSGVSYADFDDDGFTDILISTETIDSPPDVGTPVLLRSLGNDNNWCKVSLEGVVSNRDAIGARVTVGAAGMIQAREVHAGTSFVSMNSRVLTFGLGEATSADFVEVLWPSGLLETFPGPVAGASVTLVEGSTCTADLTGDLAVSVDDLVALVLGWGECAEPCPPCPGDLDGDCEVTVDDLVELVLSWGPCS